MMGTMHLHMHLRVRIDNIEIPVIYQVRGLIHINENERWNSIWDIYEKKTWDPSLSESSSPFPSK